MNASAAMDAYKQLGLQANVDGATLHELVLMLLRGAIRKSEAKLALEKADHANKGESQVRRSLLLNIYVLPWPGADPKFSVKLADLYEYMGRRIFEANTQNDARFRRGTRFASRSGRGLVCDSC